MRKFHMERERLKREFIANPDRFIDAFLDLIELNKKLETRIIYLEGQLAKNSSNSSKPPSSNGFKKTKSLRKPTGKKPGGQKGHKAGNLAPVQKPDIIERHKVCFCKQCGKSLSNQPATGYDTRQVFDLPPQKIIITEHSAETKQCSCGCYNTASFPEGVTQKVQYGPHITAQIVLMNTGHFIPVQRTQEYFKDLCGHIISTGTIINMLTRASQGLEHFEKGIKKALINSSVLNGDEPAIQVGKKLHWVHSLSTSKMVLYNIHQKRGRKAMDEFGVLPYFNGVLVHDFWKAYFFYTFLHAMCNAHILRELKFEEEERKQSWAKKMALLLISMKKKVESISVPKRSPFLQHALLRYDKIVTSGLKANPKISQNGKRGRTAQSSTRNLLERLRDYRAEILLFTKRKDIPFDNNLAERDIRMVKLKSKISGCFRSIEGAKAFFRIRGYIATARKQGISMYEALVALADGRPLTLLC